MIKKITKFANALFGLKEMKRRKKKGNLMSLYSPVWTSNKGEKKRNGRGG